MRLLATSLPVLLLLAAAGCAQQTSPAPVNHTPPAATQNPVGFDTNDYPGDDALPALRRHFAFAGYWLTNPPGEHQNGWQGKRDALLKNDFGFLVLANGKFEAEIKKAKRSGTSPAALGKKDAAAAVAAAQREHFPARTILFCAWGAEIKVSVVDPDSRPVAGAQVRILSGNRVIASQNTGIDRSAKTYQSANARASANRQVTGSPILDWER